MAAFLALNSLYTLSAACINVHALSYPLWLGDVLTSQHMKGLGMQHLKIESVSLFCNYTKHRR